MEAIFDPNLCHLCVSDGVAVRLRPVMLPDSSPRKKGQKGARPRLSELFCKYHGVVTKEGAKAITGSRHRRTL